MKSSGLPYVVEYVDIERLVPIDRNAQVMTDETLARLTSNIEHDHGLTSVPLVRDMADGKMEVVSGNHRVLAARRAGIRECLVLRWVGDMTHSQRRAIQLSHNSLVGKQDVDAVTALYAEIDDITFQGYAGIGDDVLGLSPPDLAPTLADGVAPEYQGVTVMFLPHEVAALERVVKGLATKLSKDVLVPAMSEDHVRMIGAIKGLRKIGEAASTAGAVAKMLDIVEDWLRSQGGG